MILVRRRNRFVGELVRALKAQDIAVAGVDRMILSEQLAVMDLIALGEFLLLPEDDLTLAVVLKGPLIGFDDDDLFALAYDRGDKSLWRRLTEAAAMDERYAAGHAWLSRLLAAVDFAPPYELFARILTEQTVDGESGRRRIVARLGTEAEDPVEEFMNLALAHERTETPSLQNFLHWLKAGDATITRDLEHTGRDEVRIITVHGAKGLQAPIVILPDTTTAPKSSPPILWEDGIPLWPPHRTHEPSVCIAARAEANHRRDQEYRRLLYVAMTRAEDRLLVCGWHGKQAPSDTSWYGLIRDGMSGIAEPFEFLGEGGWQGDGLRVDCPQLVDVPSSAIAENPPPETRAPDWLQMPPPAEPKPPRPLAPSRPSGEPPVLSPMLADGGDRFKRGLLIHRLLQSLPEIPTDRRRAAADAFLAMPVQNLDAETQAEIQTEVMQTLEIPEFAPLFAAGSHAETPIVGSIDGPQGPEIISGQVDRLVIRENEVVIVDYKTNRPAPRQESDVPDVYYRQMAAYRAVLRKIWPDRGIRCVLLWTDGPHTISLDERLLDRFFDAT
jgi:ATP-dependent helicase/nuclease subunit A